ncbi:hypothetical protein BU23DRAFT_197729 [Bimuria novae-zelandiae CBS 107.79]|uniref:F-box domain-containing protein n=1 Tax=Bimuria novae-zelandiae CBS 107.79 TaxID=1447943 RepID=A0A6A5V1T8_9PLEO|nr:hypothetical protein BU23DRAFT_197729 [Bimuria novae-zelandiae CBS 107.79]
MALAAKHEPPDLEPHKCPPQDSRLLKLPNEVLLSIAGKLIRNRDLCQLSLVCYRFRDVAQEALVKEALLPPYGMRGFIRTLCDRPDLHEKINSVDLGDYDYTGRSRTGVRLEHWSHYSKCRELVGNEVRNEFDGGSFNITFVWGKEHRFYLGVLFTLCPNIKEMGLRLPALGNTIMLVNPFYGALRRLLENQLQILEIRETEAYKMLRMPHVKVSHLSVLTRLKIPADALGFMFWSGGSLPSSLQYLQLKPCNHFILPWFSDLATAFLYGLLPKLRRVDLYFQACLRDSLLMINQGRNYLQPLLRLIEHLYRNHAIDIRGYNSSGLYTGDLLEELVAWSLLSGFEKWYPAKDEEFSAVVARTQDGVPRRRTQEEVRAFVSQGQPKICRFIFKPDVDLRGISNCRVLSFSTDKDELPKVCDPKFTSEFTRWSSSVAAAQRLARPELSSMPGFVLVRSEHSEQEGGGPPTSSFVFQTSEDGSDPSPGFDPEEWLGVQYFDPTLPIPGKARTRPEIKHTLKRKHKASDVTRGGPDRARRVRLKVANGE